MRSAIILRLVSLVSGRDFFIFVIDSYFHHQYFSRLCFSDVFLSTYVFIAGVLLVFLFDNHFCVF